MTVEVSLGKACAVAESPEGPGVNKDETSFGQVFPCEIKYGTGNPILGDPDRDLSPHGSAKLGDVAATRPKEYWRVFHA